MHLEKMDYYVRPWPVVFFDGFLCKAEQNYLTVILSLMWQKKIILCYEPAWLALLFTCRCSVCLCNSDTKSLGSGNSVL